MTKITKPTLMDIYNIVRQELSHFPKQMPRNFGRKKIRSKHFFEESTMDAFETDEFEEFEANLKETFNLDLSFNANYYLTFDDLLNAIKKKVFKAHKKSNKINELA